VKLIAALVIVILLLSSLASLAAGGGSDLDRLLHAIHMVEASGRLNPPDGDGGKSIGPLQIQRAYWADAVQYDKANGGRLGLADGSYESCRDLTYARRVVHAYFLRYGRKFVEAGDWESLARIHNGGPAGHRKSATLAYWAKVKRHL
jgi:hypothetical protein